MGAPEVLFDMSPYSQAVGWSYAPAPDGPRFMLMKPAAPSGPGVAQSEIVIVQNWFEELERLVPTD